MIYSRLNQYFAQLSVSYNNMKGITLFQLENICCEPLPQSWVPFVFSVVLHLIVSKLLSFSTHPFAVHTMLLYLVSASEVTW